MLLIVHNKIQYWRYKLIESYGNVNSLNYINLRNLEGIWIL